MFAWAPLSFEHREEKKSVAASSSFTICYCSLLSLFLVHAHTHTFIHNTMHIVWMNERNKWCRLCRFLCLILWCCRCGGAEWQSNNVNIIHTIVVIILLSWLLGLDKQSAAILLSISPHKHTYHHKHTIIIPSFLLFLSHSHTIISINPCTFGIIAEERCIGRQ